MSQGYIRGFDGLRAISVLFVIVTHAGAYEALENNEFFMDHVFPLISGRTGVNIFFVLSGFLITLLLLKERDQNGTISLKKFYIRRALRILPAFVILMGITGALMLNKSVVTCWECWTLSALFVSNFSPEYWYSQELRHTWSLGVEEQFYILWSIGLVFLDRMAIFWAAASTVLMSVLVAVSMTNFNQQLGGDYDISTWFIPAVAPVLIGAMAAMVFQFKKTEFLEELAPVSIVSGVLILYIASLYIHDLPGFASIVQAMGVALALLGIMMYQNAKIVDVLEFAPLRYIGRISYGLYIYQGLFLGTGPEGGLWIHDPPQSLLLTFAAAVVSYELIEKHFLRLKSRYR